MVTIIATKEATALSDRTSDPVRFIPNEDFASASEDDFQQLDFELYAAEEGRPDHDGRDAAVSFMQAIDESRLLTFEGEQFLFKRLNFLRFRANALQVTLPPRKPPRKTLKEIQRLLNEAEETRSQIVHANLRLVTSIARRIAPTPDDFDEFVAEANTILVNAIDKFDFSRGYRFSTYATHAIQRHLYRFINRAGKRRQRETASQDSIIAAEQPPEATGPSAGSVMLAAEHVLSKIDEVLDERERIIVLGRFGLGDNERAKTLRELGQELGLSKERVRQLQQQGIEKLAAVASPFQEEFVQEG